MGGVIKTRLGEDAGDPGARAMYRPRPEVAERLGIVGLGRLPSPGLPCGVVVDVPELGQQGRTDQAALKLQLLVERQVLEKSAEALARVCDGANRPQ
jgi:hypothetical protein